MSGFQDIKNCRIGYVQCSCLSPTDGALVLMLVYPFFTIIASAVAERLAGPV